MLELAVLGLLLESPMHGYELRKRLTGLPGAFRAFSYGSLYPALRRMQADGKGMHGDDSARLLNELETLFVGDRVAPRIAPFGDGLVAVFGDRRRSLGLDARVKILGPAFDARR